LETDVFPKAIDIEPNKKLTNIKYL